jgi:hypothetical protein
MSDDYEIGYGKPPIPTRFKQGQSGNPKGRPKGSKNLRTDLAEEMSEKVTIREGGHARTVSKQRAMIKAMTAKALNGDINAIAKLCGLVERTLLPDEEPEAETPLPAHDKEILKRFVERNSSMDMKGEDSEK